MTGSPKKFFNQWLEYLFQFSAIIQQQRSSHFIYTYTSLLQKICRDLSFLFTYIKVNHYNTWQKSKFICELSSVSQFACQLMWSLPNDCSYCSNLPVCKFLTYIHNNSHQCTVPWHETFTCKPKCKISQTILFHSNIAEKLLD